MTAPPSGGVLFDFDGVGNIFGGSLNVTGSLTYTVNGGAPISLNVGNTGTSLGAITADDLLVFHNPLPGAAFGDLNVLSSGSVTTAINIPGPAPTSGSYNAILVDPNGAQVGTGVVVMGWLNVMVSGDPLPPEKANGAGLPQASGASDSNSRQAASAVGPWKTAEDIRICSPSR